ncbi:MAG TPA: calcium-binding protein [Rhizomicrobium sp.]|jgi:hypothetical protein
MANVILSTNPFDMSTWDLSDIADGTVTSHTATKFTVNNTFHYSFAGTGFTTFDSHGFPTDGTITSITIETFSDKATTKITGISIAAPDFMTYVDANNFGGLETALFSGNDRLTGGTGNDVLLGLGGDDTFSMGQGGDDTVQGGAGNDYIAFQGGLTAADSIDGGAGSDKVTLNGDYSAGVIFGAATMTNVEAVSLTIGHSYVLTLNAATDTAGQSVVLSGAGLAAGNYVTLDASAVAGTIHLVGGAGNDTLIGGTTGKSTLTGNDGGDFITGGTGVNSLSGGDGDDTFTLSNWAAGSAISGGTGNDTVVFNGDFSGGVNISSSIKEITNFILDAGHDYDITMAPGHTGASNTVKDFSFDASAVTGGVTLYDTVANNTDIAITGGSGVNDINLDLSSFTGSNATQIDLSHGGGDDTVILSNYSNAGTDAGTDAGTVQYGATFTGADVVENANIALNGDYSAGVTLNAADESDSLTFTRKHSYDITLNAGIAGDGGTFTSQSSNMLATDTITLDCSAIGGHVVFMADAGHVTILGGANQDQITLTNGVNAASVNGEGGDDVITLGLLNSSYAVNGGSGNDTLVLDDTTHTAFVDISSAMIQNVETLTGDYTGSLVITSNIVAPGQMMTIILSAPGNFTDSDFNGGAETAGAFNIVGSVLSNHVTGSAGDDVFTGGKNNNYFTGGPGADLITTGKGRDILTYNAVSDSTSTVHDTVSGFDVTKDFFSTPVTVAGVNTAVNAGALSTASFDSDLAAAVGATELGANHALVFTPNAGTLAGDHFLIIDANGMAGYQAGQDYVIELTNVTNLAFTTANFT